MLNIQVFTVNMIMENCYLVWDETKEAVIIDCGAFFDEEKHEIRKFIEDAGLRLRHHICTHAHFDHIMGADFVYGTFGVKPELHAADAWLYNHVEEQTVQIMGERVLVKMPPMGDYLEENSLIAFGDHNFKVLATPGHSPGGVSFYCQDENVAFCGDSIFRRSIGRTDFVDGDEHLLIQKLTENILSLPENTVIYPGHGRHTTVGEEKRENPFFTTMQ